MTDSAGNEENPQQAEYLKHLYRGSELLLNDNIVEAREALEEASRIDPDDPKCLSLLGLVYFRLDDFEPAQQIYELLVQRFPAEASLRVNLGLVYMKQGHADKALDQMNRGVSIDPDHKRAYGYLGLLYSESGQNAQAREAFRMAGQEAMVQKMDEVIAARDAGDVPVMPEITADALPPDPEPFGAAAPEVESAPPVQSAPPEQSAVPAPGSPPPLTPAAPATPVEAMQPLTSDGMTIPVEVGAPASTQAPDAEGPVPEMAEPDVAEPDVAEPDVAEPDAAEPDVAEPDAAEPDAAEYEPAEYEPAEYEPTESDVAELDAVEPDAADPDAADPNVAESDAAELDAAELDGVPPDDTVAAGGSLDDEIDAVIEEAVAPRDPWPSESGVLTAAPPASSESVPVEAAPSEAVSSESVPAVAISSEPVPVADPVSPPAPEGVESDSVPIFSYATAELVDLSARAGRMQSPQPGTLIFPVAEDGFIRAEALTVMVGDITSEPAYRRAKGQFTDELMVDGRGQLIKVLGEGVLLCDAVDEQLTVLDLFDDFMYLRSEYLFAFESTLHWENGKVRGASGPIELIHIRGEGRLALVGADMLRKVRLVPEQVAYVAEDELVGWLGRISPQTRPLGTNLPEESSLKPMLRCEGEGVLLVRSPQGQAATSRED